MARMDQVNSLLHHELANALNRRLEMDGVLVTVTEVEVSLDLSEAKIFVSVLPDKKAGTALEQLRHISGELAKDLRKRLKFRKMPTFHWLFDSREANAASLEETIHHLHEN